MKEVFDHPNQPKTAHRITVVQLHAIPHSLSNRARTRNDIIHNIILKNKESHTL